MNKPPQCFRHQFEKLDGFCALCEAKRLSRGDFEKARKLFVPKKKRKSNSKIYLEK